MLAVEPPIRPAVAVEVLEANMRRRLSPWYLAQITPLQLVPVELEAQATAARVATPHLLPQRLLLKGALGERRAFQVRRTVLALRVQLPEAPVM